VGKEVGGRERGEEVGGQGGGRGWRGKGDEQSVADE
jgi:hypothetical protein